jgi:hypothetical protein
MLQIDSKSLKFHAKKVVITSNRHVVTKIIERKAMGLAASQARFLAITARKMNCEFQSMQIAQEKLSTTRDMEKISQDYQNALDTTKLVWDTEDDDQYELGYDVMMTPSTLNEYNPYLVTDTRGRILLTDAMFNAAVNAGVIDKDGNPSGKTFMGSLTKTITNSENKPEIVDVPLNESESGSRNKFLYELSQLNQISGSSLEMIRGLGERGYTRSGIGGAIFDKSTANALKTNQFISYMQDITYEKANTQNLPSNVTNTKEKIYSLKLDEVLSLKTETKDGESVTTGIGTITTKEEDLRDGNKDNVFYITQGGRPLTAENIKELTVGDILQGKYNITYKASGQKGYQDIYDAVLKAVGTALGLGEAGLKGINVDAESDMALDQASAFTQLNRNALTSISTKSASELYSHAEKQNNIIQGQDNIYSFSITNMAKCFLTNFAIAIDGYDCGFNIDRNSTKKSNYVTDDPTYYFLLKSDSALNEQTMLVADFYNILYNQLATNGAISDSNIREQYTIDNVMLQNAIKNGNMFISSLHNDGYYYQGAYTLSGHVVEVKDEAAIARAELEYNVQKAKLNTKEESLEIQMKNLDMEISSLTTEFDTVKNLISKNVEKVFTMFST